MDEALVSSSWVWKTFSCWRAAEALLYNRGRWNDGDGRAAVAARSAGVRIAGRLDRTLQQSATEESHLQEAELYEACAASQTGS